MYSLDCLVGVILQWIDINYVTSTKYIYIYIYIYIHTHIYIYIHTHTHTHKVIYIFTRWSKSLCAPDNYSTSSGAQKSFDHPVYIYIKIVYYPDQQMHNIYTDLYVVHLLFWIINYNTYTYIHGPGVDSASNRNEY